MLNHFTSTKSVAAMAIMLAVVLLALAAFATPAAGSNEKVDNYILEQMAANSGRANFFVKMASDAELAAAESMTDRVDRLNYVHDTLTAHAASTQADLLATLDAQGVRYVSFWINNSVYVYDGDLALVEALAARKDVAYLKGDVEVPLVAPVAMEPAPASAEAIEWGVSRVNAPDVWATGNTGQGVVVANIDTGVRWTHDAIDDQYRGSGGDHNYNWWDPDLVYAAPTDVNDHGTHTMGTMVGDDGGSNQIGVAPGAQWIAAQGCDGLSCSSFDLTSSAQWIACPTDLAGNNPNCAMAPHIVNNSWGGGSGDQWYKSYVKSWRMAGIIPVFSAGNSGPSCNTVGSPGDYPNVFGVGATNIANQLAYFSSKGPGAFSLLKPNLVAPGENVRSSVRGSDNAYANFSGTSMAAPHVAGVIALLLADTPGSTYNSVYAAAVNTTDLGLVAPNLPPNSCGGRAWNQFPNPIYGKGMIDACAAVNHPALPGGVPCP